MSLSWEEASELLKVGERIRCVDFGENEYIYENNGWYYNQYDELIKPEQINLYLHWTWEKYEKQTDVPILTAAEAEKIAKAVLDKDLENWEIRKIAYIKNINLAIKKASENKKRNVVIYTTVSSEKNYYTKPEDWNTNISVSLCYEELYKLKEFFSGEPYLYDTIIHGTNFTEDLKLIIYW